MIDISSDKELFEQEMHVYQDALKDAGHKLKLDYDRCFSKKSITARHGRPPDVSDKRPRRRSITWFIPPFNLYCSTKVGRLFRELIEKHFSKGDLVGKLFNRNRLKLSYSCVGSLKSKIAAHNRRILHPAQVLENLGSCNCRVKNECPMNGHCVWESIIYKAEVCKANEEKGSGKLYIGLVSGLWKARYSIHKGSFDDSRRKNETELSKYVWSLKENNVQFSVHWEKVSHARPYSKETKKCSLCSVEKLTIMQYLKSEPRRILNKREEILNKCLHRRKHLMGMLNT